MIMDPTKNEKFQLWKRGVDQSQTSDRLIAPPENVTQSEMVTPLEIVIPPEIVTPAPPEVVTLMESMPPPQSLPEQGRLPLPPAESLLLIPDCMAIPNSTPSFSISFESSVESGVSKQTMKRGRRSTVPPVKKGRGRLKCGLSSCVPCSFETGCGDCPQCLNKKMK